MDYHFRSVGTVSLISQHVICWSCRTCAEWGDGNTQDIYQPSKKTKWEVWTYFGYLKNTERHFVGKKCLRKAATLQISWHICVDISDNSTVSARCVSVLVEMHDVRTLGWARKQRVALWEDLLCTCASGWVAENEQSQHLPRQQTISPIYNHFDIWKLGEL